jgi:hypothetical protein
LAALEHREWGRAQIPAATLPEGEQPASSKVREIPLPTGKVNTKECQEKIDVTLLEQVSPLER